VSVTTARKALEMRTMITLPLAVLLATPLCLAATIPAGAVPAGTGQAE
jgi:hypothetical protein